MFMHMGVNLNMSLYKSEIRSSLKLHAFWSCNLGQIIYMSFEFSHRQSLGL